MRQRYLGINLRIKPHSPTEDLHGKQQLQPQSPVHRAKARLPPQQSTEYNSNSKQHSSARLRVAPPRRSASAVSPPSVSQRGRRRRSSPRQRSRSGEALQRPPRLCRAAPPDGGPAGPAPPRADVALAGRDAPLPARCSRARPAASPPRLPVTPDAVEQLHEGEGEVETEEGEEVAGSLVRQDRPVHGAHHGSPAAGTAPGGRSRSPGGPGARHQPAQPLGGGSAAAPAAPGLASSGPLT